MKFLHARQFKVFQPLRRFHLTVCIPYTCPALVRRSAKEFQWTELKRRVKEPCVNCSCFRIASPSLATWCENAERTDRSYASAMSHFVSRVSDNLVSEIRSSAGIRHRWENWDPRWGRNFFFFPGMFKTLIKNNTLLIRETKNEIIWGSYLRKHHKKRGKYI